MEKRRCGLPPSPKALYRVFRPIVDFLYVISLRKVETYQVRKIENFIFFTGKPFLNSADKVHWMRFCDWKFLGRWMFCTFYYHCRIREAMKTETPWFWLTEKPLKQHVWSRSTAGSCLPMDIKTILYSHTIFPALTHCLSGTLARVSHRTHK